MSAAVTLPESPRRVRIDLRCGDATFKIRPSPEKELQRALVGVTDAIDRIFDVGTPGAVADDAKLRCTRASRAGDLEARRYWQRIENEARREARVAETLLVELAEKRTDLFERLVSAVRRRDFSRAVAVARELVSFVDACPWAHARRRPDDWPYAPRQGEDPYGLDVVSPRTKRRRRAAERDWAYCKHPTTGRMARAVGADDSGGSWCELPISDPED